MFAGNAQRKSLIDLWGRIWLGTREGMVSFDLNFPLCFSFCLELKLKLWVVSLSLFDFIFEVFRGNTV